MYVRYVLANNVHMYYMPRVHSHTKTTRQSCVDKLIAAPSKGAFADGGIGGGVWTYRV